MQEELLKYLEDNGIKRPWFAKKLHLSRPWFHQILYGAKTTRRVAAMIEDLTKGAVSAEIILKRCGAYDDKKSD